MIGYGIATLHFEEALSTESPQCLDVLAAACWAGFRIVRSPETGLENLVVGKSRLPQFRDAKRSELTRVIKVHFYGHRIDWQGSAIRIHDWVQLYRTDPALRRVVHASDAYRQWLAGIADLFRRTPLVALAAEANRQCYGRIGGDPETLRAMHHYMEEGGI